MAEGHNYFAIGGRSVSPDNNLLVYGVDTVSRREYTLYVKDLRTGEVLEDRIPRPRAARPGQRQQDPLPPQEGPRDLAFIADLQARAGHRRERGRAGV